MLTMAQKLYYRFRQRWTYTAEPKQKVFQAAKSGNAVRLGLQYFAKRNETKRNEMVLCETVLCETVTTQCFITPYLEYLEFH